MRPFLLATVVLVALPLGGCDAAQRLASEAMAAATPATPRPGADWSTTAEEFRGRLSQRYAYTCPAGGQAGPVWGNGPYTDDSSVCTAAVHAGAVTFSRGGPVVVEIRDGQASYSEGRSNGVDGMSYDAWEGSFVVVR
ncbi:MAG TPA: LCCL domain-containing protein [Rubricoccaceae bacterium]|jgi:hypothetical protein